MKAWWSFLIWALLLRGAMAHNVDSRVDSAPAVVITVRLGEDEVASFSEYEVFAPGETQPFQVGRSDRQGRVVFAPDTPGKWRVKVKADSAHGIHGATVDVEVSPEGVVVAHSQPLVARHTRLWVGLGLLFGIFGVLSLLKRTSSSVPS